jgi:hypothetical protein
MRARLVELDTEKEVLIGEINLLEIQKEEKRKEVIAYFEAQQIIQVPPEI